MSTFILSVAAFFGGVGVIALLAVGLFGAVFFVANVVGFVGDWLSNVISAIKAQQRIAAVDGLS